MLLILSASGRECATLLALCCFLLLTQAEEEVNQTGPDYIATITLVATHAGKDGTQVKRDILIGVRSMEDAAAAAARGCYEHDILPTDQVLNVLSYIKNSLDGKNHQPDIQLLRTAGAYMKRAAELSTNDQYIDAAADLIRAIDRNGLDATVRSRISQLLQDAFKDQKGYDEQLEKERQIAEELERREKAEREAEEESARRKAMDETDWTNFKEELQRLMRNSESADEEGEVLASVSFHLEGKGKDGNKVSEDIAVSLQASQDVSEVAFQFCSSKGLHSHAEVLKVKRELINQASRKGYKSKSDIDVEEMKRTAKRLEKEGAFLQAGTAYAKILHAMEEAGEIDPAYKASLDRMLQVVSSQRFSFRVLTAYSSFIDGKYEDAVRLLDEILPAGQNSTMLLVKAKSHQLLGQVGEASEPLGGRHKIRWAPPAGGGAERSVEARAAQDDGSHAWKVRRGDKRVRLKLCARTEWLMLCARRGPRRGQEGWKGVGWFQGKRGGEGEGRKRRRKHPRLTVRCSVTLLLSLGMEKELSSSIKLFSATIRTRSSLYFFFSSSSSSSSFSSSLSSPPLPSSLFSSFYLIVVVLLLLHLLHPQLCYFLLLLPLPFQSPHISPLLMIAPLQQEISKQYKSLKQLLKLLKEADEKIQKSQNHKVPPRLSSTPLPPPPCPSYSSSLPLLHSPIRLAGSDPTMSSFSKILSSSQTPPSFVLPPSSFSPTLQFPCSHALVRHWTVSATPCQS
eukprot:761288-Hanusia_phi.AAC.1